MLQNKFNETQSHLSWNFFLVVEIKTFTYPLKKTQQNTAKKPTMEHVNKKKLNAIYMRCVFYLPLNHIAAPFTCIL